MVRSLIWASSLIQTLSAGCAVVLVCADLKSHDALHAAFSESNQMNASQRVWQVGKKLTGAQWLPALPLVADGKWSVEQNQSEQVCL